MRMIVLICCLCFAVVPGYSQERDHIYLFHPPNFDTTTIEQLLRQAEGLKKTKIDYALLLYHTAWRKSTQLKYGFGEIRSVVGLGESMFIKGEWQKAMMYFKEAYKLMAERPCESRTKATLFNGMAAFYGNRGVFDSAAYFYYRTLYEMERFPEPDPSFRVMVYSNLGGFLTANRDFQTAFEYLRRAEYLAKRPINVRSSVAYMS